MQVTVGYMKYWLKCGYEVGVTGPNERQAIWCCLTGLLKNQPPRYSWSLSVPPSWSMKKSLNWLILTLIQGGGGQKLHLWKFHFVLLRIWRT